jgi:hypothetical protein
MKNDDVSNLLYQLIKTASFDRVRLYLYDPSENVAYLKYSVSRPTLNENLSSEWSAFNKVPYNYQKFFKNESYDDNSFLDLICRFKTERTFVAKKIGSMSNIPREIIKFNEEYNINEMSMTSLLKSGDQYIGHIIADNSLSSDYTISDHQLSSLNEFISMFNDMIIDSLEKIRDAYEQEHTPLSVYFDLDSVNGRLAAEIISTLSGFYGEPLDIVNSEPLPPGTDLFGSKYKKAG